MRPGSIYTGFGSKDATFLQVLDCYVEQSLIKIDKYNRLANHPLEALKDFCVWFYFCWRKARKLQSLFASQNSI